MYIEINVYHYNTDPRYCIEISEVRNSSSLTRNTPSTPCRLKRIEVTESKIKPTPGNDNQSPASRLFCRQPRSTLPSLILSTSTPPNLKKSQANTKARYDKQAKDLPDIQPGTVVRIRTKEDKNWNQLSNVVAKCAEPRSYRVLNDKGNIVRRNRRQLLPCKEKFCRDKIWTSCS